VEFGMRNSSQQNSEFQVLSSKLQGFLHHLRKWRNWQTHQLEGLAVAIS
jgi:hypothetical protein